MGSIAVACSEQDGSNWRSVMVKFNLVLWTDLVDRALVDFVDKS